MPVYVTKHQTRQRLTATDEQLSNLSRWIYNTIEDALVSAKQREAVYRENLKMYNGVPKLATRNIPIPNAPNIEVTIGAIAADTIYAQIIDLVFGVSPLVTVRPKPKVKGDQEAVNDAKAMQRWVNHIATSPEYNLRLAVDNASLDDVQLGTGAIYIPYVEKTKKTKTAKTLSTGPRFYAVPPEDVIISGASSQGVQEVSLMALRFYYTPHEITSSAKTNKWSVDGIQPVHSKSNVRETREMLGRQKDNQSIKGTLFDVFYVYCHYDIDDDGYEEELFISWNHSGRKIMSYGYMAEDHRPLEIMVYQRQAHLFHGIGVLQMVAPFEEKLSDIHNYATLNSLLANSRVWVGAEGLPETLKLWPGKYIQTPNPREDLQALQMADIYSSIWQDQMITMKLANQRVGINEVSQGASIPSRTPGVTAMSFLQQVNRRFTPAFDSVRLCIAAAIRQACYRFQERLLAGDKKVEAAIWNVLGWDDGNRVINILRKESFDEHVDMELTAASASINKEADRQNAIMLTNILGQYYQRTIELVMLAANPETPPEVAKIAKKVADSAGEIIDRTIRTFDQVRDPETFIIQVEDELESIGMESGDQQALGQLMQYINGGQQQLLPSVYDEAAA